MLLCGCQSAIQSAIHPIEQPNNELRFRCQAASVRSCDRLHTFIIGGIDLDADAANLDGLCDYLQKLGFRHTHSLRLYGASYAEREIRRIHAADPAAHFALIGFSFGANMARDTALAVQDDGITIDLLVYLGGNTLSNIPRDQPDNAVRILNILAKGWIWHGDNLDRAENIQIDHVWHFGSPSHPMTIERIANELAAAEEAIQHEEPIKQPQAHLGGPVVTP
jgi:hypothetical protein